jgi:hypothetical protein
MPEVLLSIKIVEISLVKANLFWGDFEPNLMILGDYRDDISSRHAMYEHRL